MKTSINGLTFINKFNIQNNPKNKDLNSEYQFKKILVYRIGHLGDTIVSLPTFWAIREKFPKSEITLLTNSDSSNKNLVLARDVLPQKGLFDDYLVYENPQGKLNKLNSYGKLLLKLRKKKFDSVFYLSTRNRSISQINRDVKFFRAAGIKQIFGTDYLKNNRLEIEISEHLPKVGQEYKFLLNSLPTELFGQVTVENYSLELTEVEKNFADKWLADNCGVDFNKKLLVAVAPGSKWDSKTWFEPRFVNVVSKLIKEKNIFPIIFGGKEDFEKGQRILSNFDRGANAAGKLNIRQAAAALRQCVFYVGNDTGTMHLAAAVETPCVGIFAAIDYNGRWYPFGENNKVIRYTVECQGCHNPICFNNNKCLDLVSEDEVYQACCEIFDELNP